MVAKYSDRPMDLADSSQIVVGVDIIGSDRPDLVIERLKVFLERDVQAGARQEDEGNMRSRA